MPSAPRRRSADRALKRLAGLSARLPDDATRGEFEKVIAQVESAVKAAQGERQAMADRLSEHESSIAELQARVAELGQANANQARLLSALTQTPPGATAETLVLPTSIPRPTILPTIFPPTLPPTPSPGPTPSPSPGPTQASATPVAIATAFQTAFTALQAAPGAPGSAIRSMDVQIKGLVQVAADGSETTMTFPSPENPISGDVLSTVSMSLAAVPELSPTKRPG